MSPAYKATLAPRIVVLLGALAVAAPLVVQFTQPLEAWIRLAGGLTSLCGVAWFLLAQRRFAATRRAQDEGPAR